MKAKPPSKKPDIQLPSCDKASVWVQQRFKLVYNCSLRCTLVLGIMANREVITCVKVDVVLILYGSMVVYRDWMKQTLVIDCTRNDVGI